MQIRHLQLDEFLNSYIILEQFSHIISSTYFLYFFFLFSYTFKEIKLQ